MNDQRKVGFTEMKHGTKSDYDLLHELEKPFLALTADRVLDELHRQGEATLEGYKITRLDHALQSATRAHREGADIDWVVGALLHDIGDGLAPQNHDRMSAEVIRPFVREEVSWVVEHHGIFQMLYYGHHYGWDRNARDRYKDHPSFDACAAFCERWDQTSFDPDYDSEDLEFFEPMVREVFGRKAHDPDVVRAGYAVGLPESGASLRIKIDDLRGPEIAALLEAHLDLMRSQSPPESVHALDLDTLRAPDITFWTIWHSDELLGCCALKVLGAGHGEIKSMHTAHKARGKGIAAKMLSHLERHARNEGLHTLSLETGSQGGFAPARALYARFGYRPCGPFADYTHDPHSAFMTKQL